MKKPQAKILVIDDERTVCISCKRVLEDEGHIVDYTLSGQEGLEKVLSGDYDLVLLDLKMPGINGLAVLETLKEKQPDIIVIIITGYATIQTSIEAIKKGAFDYVPKPFTPEELAVTVSKAMETRALQSENIFLKQRISGPGKKNPIIGRSSVMEDLMRQIMKIAPTDFTVTIHGRSGTGKELVARAIHDNSNRADKPFIAVDISALTATLIESELFGHVRGAFTGATQGRPGYFSIAHGGTLFLDEISNISLELQGKLLRVLESRRIRPVGSEQEHEVDVRLIAATNMNLQELVENKSFREDLYYRLNVIPIMLPPLSDRKEDIPPLAEYFLREAIAESGVAVRGFTTGAMARLVSYRWPGNVRELRNLIYRLAATVDSELIGTEHLPSEMNDTSAGALSSAMKKTPLDAAELKKIKTTLRQTMYTGLEKKFVIEALDRADWNVTRAAELVGMLRPNFHALMKKCGIKTKDNI